MKVVTKISKIAFLLSILLVGCVFYGTTANAANFKPYEYTFKVATDSNGVGTKFFSGIKGVKDLVITFDSENIAKSIIDGSTYTVTKVVGKGDNETNSPLDIVDTSNIKTVGNVVTIPFKNLEYIDYSGANGIDYQLVIEKNGNNYVFPFVIHDILPGFKSVFLDLNADEINELVFAHNAPREIMVYIPKYHLTKIETIHRNEGLVNNANVNQASLTNIDVLTDKAIERLKVSFNGNPVRDLDVYQSGFFTMGYAGIKFANAENLREFGLNAYDAYGRFLDTENFKVNFVNNTTIQNQIKVSNYITKKAGDFGKTYTLYDLMSKPTIFENILKTLSVDELNKLGITYANAFSTVNVANIEQFELAINNNKINTINITEDITGDVVLPRSLTINGKKEDGSKATINGNLTLGKGSDINVNLNNLVISDELKIDVGTGGNVYLTDVSSNNTNVVSGNKNSVYMKRYTSNRLIFNNIAPVRVVLTGSNAIPVELKSEGEVILEGDYGQVDSINDSAKLTLEENSSISGLTINGAQLTITYPPTVKLPEKTGSGTLKEVNTEDTETGDGDKSVELLGKTPTLRITQNGSLNLSKDISLKELPEISQKIEKWEVENPNVFGSGTVSVEVLDSVLTLNINDLELIESEKLNMDVILIGEIDGKKYKLIVPVEIKK